ncbi:MAG: hypothetical protein HOB84_10875 [Candidatus Marinimicrobia bacterium]|jgi:hypothetical protein|nr:hypothetical protein [Candidatus Neomarinimicrobiota bacterium]MBT4033563.1 hypothetical protein [Candidatus Neomarinimicrobiota bacterium]MBT4360210.1 hypothetical protein [Candidatus Neomarinimicrobiota bacterium]MBT4715266.1 hypothetical protein [Candidatus Neomarinimicrobiota bacterium]MBT4947909.1 hypothetical protein [Candidatus Neomarinimicrobiota bacterium]
MNKHIQLIFRKTTGLSLLVLLFIGCTEEMSIADFAEYYKNYKQEIRIEGLLDNDNFANSIIRVDRTILVTDTSLYNGRDDNGDWVSYTDENGNNRWDEGEPLNDDIGYNYGGPNDEPEGRGNGIADAGEPHVDDYIEILHQIHDSTMVSVILREAASQNFVAEFFWETQAAEFDVIYGPGGPPEAMASNPYITYHYGAYIPAPEYAGISLDENLEYQMVLTTSEGRIITASTDIVGPPVNIFWENSNWVGDTLVSNNNNYAFMTWNNSSLSSFCAVYMDEYFVDGSTKDFYGSLAVSIFSDDSTGLPQFQGNFAGIPLGLYQVKFESVNEIYGNYVYSGLPLRDRELSNWRDQDGNVILGALGSKTAFDFYLRFNSANG